LFRANYCERPVKIDFASNYSARSGTGHAFGTAKPGAAACCHWPNHRAAGAAAARGEGNFLLNVGPKPDGSIPAEEQAILRKIGKWMRLHGEGIYGSQMAPTFGTTIAF
jgi:hypothetical protein